MLCYTCIMTCAAARRRVRGDDHALGQQAQVAKSVAGKRETIFAKRDKLAQRKSQLHSEYETSATRTEDNKAKVLKGEDWKQKFEARVARTPSFHSLTHSRLFVRSVRSPLGLERRSGCRVEFERHV